MSKSNVNETVTIFAAARETRRSELLTPTPTMCGVQYVVQLILQTCTLTNTHFRSRDGTGLTIVLRPSFMGSMSLTQVATKAFAAAVGPC